MRLSLVGSTGWFGSTHSSRLPLPLVSSTIGVQPCAFASSPVSSKILAIEPAERAGARPARAHPQRVVGVLGEDQMMRLVAGADQRDLAALRIDHREMPRRVLHREHFRRRMVRALLAEVRIGRRADARGEPDLALLVVHRIVRRGLAVPDHLLAPVGRRRQRIVLRRRRLRIAHRHRERWSPCG